METSDMMAFKTYLEKRDQAKATVYGYLSDMRVFIRWFEGARGEEFTAVDLNEDDIRAFRQFLLDQGMKPNSINRKLAALAIYGKWAKDTGILSSNPTINVHGVQSVQLAPKWLSPKEKAALLRAALSDLDAARANYPRLWLIRLRDTSILVLMLNTGLRVSEVCALRLDDIKLSPRKGTLTVRQGKGYKQRTIPLNNQCREWLESYRKERPAGPSQSYFISQRGGPVCTRAIQIAVERYARQANLKHVTAHMLRHSFAKALIDQKVPIQEAAALLGHSDINTTRIYTTPSEQDLEEAIKKLEEL